MGKLLPLVLIVSLFGVPAASALYGSQVNAGEAKSKAPEKSAYLAFVDREYVFTLEVVKPDVLIFNFISMADKEHSLQAKLVRVALENRNVPAKFFVIDTGNPKEPVLVPSLRMKPRSSFGVRLQGEFGGEKEFSGATVRIGQEDFKLVPLASFDFENLLLKVNRINLQSPDFRDDWRILKLEILGARQNARL